MLQTNDSISQQQFTSCRVWMSAPSSTPAFHPLIPIFLFLYTSAQTRQVSIATLVCANDIRRTSQINHRHSHKWREIRASLLLVWYLCTTSPRGQTSSFSVYFKHCVYHRHVASVVDDSLRKKLSWVKNNTVKEDCEDPPSAVLKESPRLPRKDHYGWLSHHLFNREHRHLYEYRYVSRRVLHKSYD